eukprot:TRINITY_DN3021_c0_g1_i1.p2 TRINITY_DN3021_c0_g1~~TRINITY_DN3021_c0_g1_i1.p2  ORF type:complete len:64 (+),score=19.76 TRINITY_DN3021_c0_g1_i1:155-346(+)
MAFTSQMAGIGKLIACEESTDGNGWEFAVDFPGFFSPKEFGCFVRRRKWKLWKDLIELKKDMY